MLMSTNKKSLFEEAELFVFVIHLKQGSYHLVGLEFTAMNLLGIDVTLANAKA